MVFGPQFDLGQMGHLLQQGINLNQRHHSRLIQMDDRRRAMEAHQQAQQAAQRRNHQFNQVLQGLQQGRFQSMEEAVNVMQQIDPARAQQFLESQKTQAQTGHIGAQTQKAQADAARTGQEIVGEDFKKINAFKRKRTVPLLSVVGAVRELAKEDPAAARQLWSQSIVGMQKENLSLLPQLSDPASQRFLMEMHGIPSLLPENDASMQKALDNIEHEAQKELWATTLPDKKGQTLFQALFDLNQAEGHPDARKKALRSVIAETTKDRAPLVVNKIGPDGTKANPAVVTEAQKKWNAGKQILGALAMVEDNFDPKLVGAGRIAELFVPKVRAVIGGLFHKDLLREEDLKTLTQSAGFYSTAGSLVEAFLRSQTGAQANKEEIKAYNAIITAGKAEKLLTTPEEYAAALKTFGDYVERSLLLIKPTAEKGIMDFSLPERGLRRASKDRVETEDDVKKFMADNPALDFDNLSDEELDALLEQQGL